MLGLGKRKKHRGDGTTDADSGSVAAAAAADTTTAADAAGKKQTDKKARNQTMATKNGKWTELRPFHPEDDHASEINLKKILDHIDAFLLVLMRDRQGVVRTYVRTASRHRATLDMLDGLEAVAAQQAPVISGFATFRRYVTKRHCALSVVPAEMERTSIYRLLGHEVEQDSCLVFNARKTDSPTPITEFVRCIDRGINPESISRLWSSGKTRVSQRLRTKMAEANRKLQTRNMFACRIYTCTHSLADTRTIEDVFPARAFRQKKASLKSVLKGTGSSVRIPMFGASHMPILSDTEILGFLAMPDLDDLADVNFDFGQLRSKAAGVPEGSMMPDAVDDDDDDDDDAK